VPFLSLQTRRAGTASQRDTKPKLINLTVTEEEAIKQYILELDLRGFAPLLNAV